LPIATPVAPAPRRRRPRSEVNGTTKKSKKQKGGGARHGALTAPIFVGGGVTFAAKPRSFAQKVNRKMYRARSAAILSELNRQGRIKVVESFDCRQPKTKGWSPSSRAWKSAGVR
jgi:large subunit ribosomal protein L4